MQYLAWCTQASSIFTTVRVGALIGRMPHLLCQCPGGGLTNREDLGRARQPDEVPSDIDCQHETLVEGCTDSGNETLIALSIKDPLHQEGQARRLTLYYPIGALTLSDSTGVGLRIKAQI